MSLLRASAAAARGIARRLSTVAYAYDSGARVIAPTKLTAPPSPPPAGFVAVKWLAAGVDASDLDPASIAAAPPVAGTEGVGVVTAVGSGVTVMDAGDHVVPIKMGLGTWCQEGQVSATDVVRVPSSVRTELAATLPGSPVTAFILLQRFCADLGAGDVVVHTGADGAVGAALAQLGRPRGLRVVSIIDDAALELRDYAPTIERLKLHGATVAVGQSFVSSEGMKAVMADLPKPKVCLQPTGYGHDVSGLLDGQTKTVTYGYDAASGKNSFSLKKWLNETDRDVVEQTVLDVADLMHDGKLSGWLQRVDFNDLPAAIEQGGQTRRKLVAMM